MKIRFDRKIWAWSFYDWANSAFATTVMAAFFPIFFKKYWAADLNPQESTFYLGTTMSIAALIFAAFAPILGSTADLYGWAKRGVLIFATLGSITCFAFFPLQQGEWVLALIVYAISWLGFAGGNLFYDSLLTTVCKEDEMDWVSCLGYGMGYLGGGVLIILNALMVTKPELFGLANAAEGVKWAFATVGLWWLVFTVPLMLIVEEKPALNPQAPWWQGFKEVWQTLQKIKHHKNLVLFLVAFFFYIDGVHTIFKMAVDFALAINLESGDLIKAIILVQFVGFPATLLFAKLPKMIGLKNSLFLGIFIYSIICFVGAFISTATHFFIMAFVLGCVQGGVQALSRSCYATLIPEKKMASEYFGFYNMFGKFSAVLGPFLVGLTSLISKNSRVSLIAIFVLFLIGALLLSRVKIDARE